MNDFGHGKGQLTDIKANLAYRRKSLLRGSKDWRTLPNGKVDPPGVRPLPVPRLRLSDTDVFVA